MEDIVIQIHKLLIKSRKTIAVVESCTAGLLSNFLTQISGSSQYFILGIVAYNNQVKEEVLKIPSAVIASHGAVSNNVAKLMAKSARLMANSDLGIGITGIAGPSGGSKEKPVGTVFIVLDTGNNLICKKFIFKGRRLGIRKKAALKAMELLKNFLK